MSIFQNTAERFGASRWYYRSTLGSSVLFGCGSLALGYYEIVGQGGTVFPIDAMTVAGGGLLAYASFRASQLG